MGKRGGSLKEKKECLADLLHNVEGWSVQKKSDTMTRNCLSCLLLELLPTRAAGHTVGVPSLGRAPTRHKWRIHWSPSTMLT